MQAADIPAEQFGALTQEIAQTLGHGDLTPALERCVTQINAGVTQNFDEADAPHRGPWPARKDPRPRHPLLILSGDLKAAATEPGAKGHIQEIGPRDAVTGVDSSEIPYAWTHQAGDPSRNIAQREYEDVTDAVWDACTEVVADRLMELLS